VKATLRATPPEEGDQSYRLYAMKTMVTGVNNTSRRITAIRLQFTNAETNYVLITERVGLRIDPYAAYAFGKSNRDFMTYARDLGSPESLVAEVIGVRFDDGSTWGDAPETQPPPPPPPAAYGLPHPPGQGTLGAPGAPNLPPGGPGFGPAGASGPARRPGEPGAGPPLAPLPMQDREGVEPPVIMNRVLPEYTEQARMNNTEGTVDLRALVDKNGAVKSVKIVKGLPDGLNQSAEKAVRQLRFKPAMKNGEAVEFWTSLAVEFYNR
jgi:TonB family protein